jgi:catechol 2,3-dioxygenase-like lactoylglutathione lyase family enzyme
MSISINHMIVFAADKEESAQFLAEILGRPAPTRWNYFATVDLGEGSLVQFATADFSIQAQHYAFLVSEVEFDAIYQRIVERRLQHWADPQMKRPNEYNTNHGGRGVYFQDPSGHNLEVLTAPYTA